MLYIPIPSDAIQREYLEKILPKIKNKLKSLSSSFKTVFNDTKLENLLLCNVEVLLNTNNAIMSVLIPDFNQKELNVYLKNKLKDKKLLTKSETKIKNKYEQVINDIHSLFNYESFLSKSKYSSYFLAKSLNRNTCTYCNRLYTITVIEKDNNYGRITRPQFDHWYAKSKYPLLSLSIFNLIPSCSVCNSSIKGDSDFDLNKHIHPYKKEENQNFKFSFNSLSVYSNNVTIKVKKSSKIDNTLREFKIQEVYNAHSEFELKDLIDLRKKYSENYLDILINETFANLSISKNEIYRLIFGIEESEDDFHKRPFSKFKTDIIDELLKIK